jgi:hypothetical protein
MLEIQSRNSLMLECVVDCPLPVYGSMKLYNPPPLIAKAVGKILVRHCDMAA